MNAGIVLIHPDPRKNESLATIIKGMGSVELYDLPRFLPRRIVKSLIRIDSPKNEFNNGMKPTLLNVT